MPICSRKALIVGRDYAEAYRAAKRRAGAVDFDDLIRATVALLDQPGMGEWVRYKLDQATDHVLIDEAQDTNAERNGRSSARSWAIFSRGRARSDRKVRTLVHGRRSQAGDLRVPGHRPGLLQRGRAFVSWAAPTVDERLARRRTRSPFERLSLTASFRSTRPILEFVDAAIGALPGEGMGAVDLELHASEVRGPGQVNLWSPTLAEQADDDGEEGWVADAVRAHATRIARQVKAWIDDGVMLESKGRRLRPEDVMILVKRRGELASLIVARLYAEGVPVAGVDRLRLTAPLAVQDLLAAIRFVLQPRDDLALASLLVSPLIGWSQDELMRAAMKRRGEFVAASPGDATGRAARAADRDAAPRRFHHAVRVPRRIAHRAAGRAAQAAPAAGRRRRAIRSRSCSTRRWSSSESRSRRCSAFSTGSIAAMSRSCAIPPRRSMRCG